MRHELGANPPGDDVQAFVVYFVGIPLLLTLAGAYIGYHSADRSTRARSMKVGGLVGGVAGAVLGKLLAPPEA